MCRMHFPVQLQMFSGGRPFVLLFPAVPQIILICPQRRFTRVKSLGKKEEQPFFHPLKTPLSMVFLLEWKCHTSHVVREA